MQNINVFHKGIVTDLDYSKRGNDMWDFPTLNARIMNKEGQGLIITNVVGNAYEPDKNIGITLSESFVAIACKEYNGVLYIISLSEQLRKVEFGSFPSPACITVTYGEIPEDDVSLSINTSIQGFEQKYKPFVNYYDDITLITPTREVFRVGTDRYTLNINYPPELLTYEEYDNSVNLYITGFELNGKLTYNSVVNSGFNQKGQLTEKYYDKEYFPNIVSHIPLVNNIPTIYDNGISNIRLEKGGSLKGGNIFLFCRYINDNFNRTSFITEIGPIPIYNGDEGDITSIEGIHGEEVIQLGTTISNNSDKRIHFTLYNIDRRYKFIEFAIVRYYSGESTVVLHESKLVDKLFKIEDDTLDIIITGHETMLNISDTEIINSENKELTWKTHTILNRKYFGANFYKINTYNDYLIEYAKLIIPNYDVSTKLTTLNGYRSVDSMLNKVGYFRSEIYPVGIVYVFKGGLHSEVYQTSGYDYYNTNTEVEEGIIRFPSIYKEKLYDTNYTKNKKLNILSLKFNNTIANNYVLSNVDVKKFFDENIIGYYYVRGDRFKNMTYQGLLMYGCRGYRFLDNTDDSTIHYDGIMEQYEECKNLFICKPESSYYFSDDFYFPAKDVGDEPKTFGILQYGQSEFLYDLNTDTEDTLDSTDTNTSVSEFTKIYWDDSIYSGWYGQARCKFTEDQAESSYFGACRGKLENLQPGGKKDIVNGTLYNEIIYNDDELVMPIYKGYLPNTMVHLKADDGRKVNRNYMSRCFYVEKKYGLFSTDNIFDPMSFCPDNNYLSSHYHLDYIENYNPAKDNDDWINPIDLETDLDKYGYDVYPMWYKSDIHKFNAKEHEYIDNIKYSIIEKYSLPEKALDGFVSEYTDLGYDDINTNDPSSTSSCMWYWFKVNSTLSEDRLEGASNRSMSTSKYIGLTLNEHKEGINLSLCSLYKINPATISSSQLVNYFDLKNTKYYKISELINYIPSSTTAFENTSTKLIFKGDCYLQSTYIKQMSFRGKTFLKATRNELTIINGAEKDCRESNDDQPLICDGHGLVIEIISENAINTSFRYSQKDRTFFPKCKEDGLKSFAVYNPDTADKTESLLVNFGNSITSTFKQYSAYNKDIDYHEIHYNTRIRYSDVDVSTAFVDSFRKIDIMQYKDYNKIFGDIVKIDNLSGKLISYQERQINLHYTDQRQLQIPTNEYELKVGTSTGLEQQVSSLSEYGCQHQRGIVKGLNGLYSLDWNRRAIVRISLNMRQQDETLKNMLSTEVYAILESIKELTDITQKIQDTPYRNKGLSLGYDRKYNEVLFSIMYEDYNETLAFNELIDSFTTKYSFYTPLYGNINNDLYSLYYVGNYYNSNMFYLHDVGERQTFYNILGNFDISVIVNGGPSLSMYSKRFDSLEIEASETGFSEIRYYTLKQEGLHDNFDVNDIRFWLAPEYNEGKWKFPIQAQTNPDNEFYIEGYEFMEESKMRGEWLKININYLGTDEVFIKNIITNFEISNF
jgi:hypothetical protein